MINPICPHITEELWEKLGNKGFIAESVWPKFDEKKMKIKNKKVDLSKKIIEMAAETISKLKEKGQEISKVYIYVIPFEIDKIDPVKVSKELGKEIIIYSVRDSDKYDPENKSKKAKLELPSMYFE